MIAKHIEERPEDLVSQINETAGLRVTKGRKILLQAGDVDGVRCVYVSSTNSIPQTNWLTNFSTEGGSNALLFQQHSSGTGCWLHYILELEPRINQTGKVSLSKNCNAVYLHKMVSEKFQGFFTQKCQSVDTQRIVTQACDRLSGVLESKLDNYATKEDRTSDVYLDQFAAKGRFDECDSADFLRDGGNEMDFFSLSDIM